MAVQAPRTPSRGSLTRSAGAAFGRGLLLALLALAIGVLLLAYALDDGNTAAVATGDPTASTAAGATSTQNSGGTGSSTAASPTTQAPVTAVTHSPDAVPVLLLNANGIGGIAGANRDQLTAKAFANVTTGDAPARIDQTVVYYLDLAYQPDAAVVAKTLNIPDAQVLPLTDPATAGITPGDAQVVVILGTDGKHFRPA